MLRQWSRPLFALALASLLSAQEALRPPVSVARLFDSDWRTRCTGARELARAEPMPVEDLLDVVEGTAPGDYWRSPFDVWYATGLGGSSEPREWRRLVDGSRSFLVSALGGEERRGPWLSMKPDHPTSSTWPWPLTSTSDLAAWVLMAGAGDRTEQGRLIDAVSERLRRAGPPAWDSPHSTLIRILGTVSVEALESLLLTEPELREDVARELGRYRKGQDALTKLAGAEDREFAYVALHQLPDEVILTDPVLAERTLEWVFDSPPRRWNIFGPLGPVIPKIGGPALRRSWQACRSENMELRERGLGTLFQSGDSSPDSFDAVLPILEDERGEFRSGAALILGQMDLDEERHQLRSTALLERVSKDEDESVRVCALFALGGTPQPLTADVVALLLRAAFDGRDTLLRAAALHALRGQGLGSRSPIPYLEPMLDDTELCEDAAILLAAHGESALPALRRAILDASPSDTVLPAALATMSAAATRSVAAWLEDESPKLRRAAILFLSNHVPESPDAILALLEDPQAWVRIAALTWTREHLPAPEVEAICQDLLGGDSSLAVRLAAADGLGSLDAISPESLDLLVETYQGSIRAAAAAWPGLRRHAPDLAHQLAHRRVAESGSWTLAEMAATQLCECERNTEDDRLLGESLRRWQQFGPTLKAILVALEDSGPLSDDLFDTVADILDAELPKGRAPRDDPHDDDRAPAQIAAGILHAELCRRERDREGAPGLPNQPTRDESMQTPTSDTEAERKFDLAFVLVSRPELPDRGKLIESARRLGVALTAVPNDDEPQSQTYELVDGKSLIVSLMPVPHPDARDLCCSVTSPDPEVAAAAESHYLVTLFKSDGTVRERDARMAKLTAAVVASSPAVGAMLGRGWAMHGLDVFAAVREDDSADSLPVQVCIDLSRAREDGDRVSVLTHGMRRYDRENILIYAPIAETTSTLDFALSIADTMLQSPADAFPTGDTIGRSEDERIVIERGPSPANATETVIVLRIGG